MLNKGKKVVGNLVDQPENQKGLLSFRSSPLDFFKWGTILMPLWWWLGIKFIIFHLLVLISLIVFLITEKGKGRGLPREVIWLLIFIFVYCMAIIINIKQAPFMRVVASFYNLSHWIMGAVILIILYNTINKSFILSFFKGITVLGGLSGVIYIVAIIFWLNGQKIIQITSLLQKLIGIEKTKEAQLFFLSLNPYILSTEFILGKFMPRASIFEIYPTAMGALLFFMIMITLVFYKFYPGKVMKLILGLEYLALLGTLSRSAILLAFMGSVAFWFFSKKKKNILNTKIKVAALIVVCLLGSWLFLKTQNFIFEFRKDSSEYRAQLYKVTLKEAKKKPILGYGIKPRIEQFDVPLGSHSTYLGVFFKTGILGLLIFGIFWILIISRWWRNRFFIKEDLFLKYLWLCTGSIILGGLLWMITEDLDAPSIVCFIYFLIVGMGISLGKLKNNEN